LASNAETKAELAQNKVEGLEETVSNLSGVVVTANEKADEALAGVEVANGKVSELTAKMGDIETALDKIIEIQEELIGGDA
jgi:chromosome condensin MukBEF ATPase and DNA-binding subunit MukB